MGNFINLPEIPDESLKQIIELGDKHIGKTYDNIINEPTKETGIGIASLIKLVFSSVKYLGSKADLFFAYKLRTYQIELEQKLNAIPIEKRTEPDIQTILLALENSKFCITNDELRHMFVNLISNTINKDKKDIAHPAYAEIIKQMNNTDALVLKSFLNSHSQPIFELRDVTKSGQYLVLASNLFILPIDEIEDDLRAVITSITNLNRLELVKIDYNKQLSDKEKYKSLSEYIDEVIKQNSFNKETVTIVKGSVRVTPLGDDFISICLSD